MGFREKLNADIIQKFAKLDGADSAIVLYYNTFNELPNMIHSSAIEDEEVLDYLIKKYSVKNTDIINIETIRDVNEIVPEKFYVFINNEKLLFYCGGYNLILYYSIEMDYKVAQDIVFEIHSKFKHSIKKKPELGLITLTQNGLELSKININKIELNLLKNYNDDFIAVHEDIINNLNKKNSKGILLLHGKPGTGKTSYLRFLLQEIKEKNIIYVSPEVSHELGQPSFMTFMLNHSNSILIIEDAETLIKDRNNESAGLVSNLLNLSDGLLSDCLHLQIICTFNTELKNIDKALLRKGRLIARYEFNELTNEKTNSLLDYLYKGQYKSDKKLTLSDIYNYTESNYSIDNNTKIGF
jgi:hypothetical protein